MNFIDSSIFVSLFDETDPARQGRARAIVRSALQESWTVSYQVVQETLDVLTRKIPTPLTSDQARRFLDAVLLPLWSVAPSGGTLSSRSGHPVLAINTASTTL